MRPKSGQKIFVQLHKFLLTNWGESSIDEVSNRSAQAEKPEIESMHSETGTSFKTDGSRPIVPIASAGAQWLKPSMSVFVRSRDYGNNK